MNRHDLAITASAITGLTITQIDSLLHALILASTSVYALVRVVIEIRNAKKTT